MSSRKSRLVVPAIAAAISIGFFSYLDKRAPGVHAQAGSVIYLGSPKKVEGQFQGEDLAVRSFSSGTAKPLSLAADDFDGDGVTDLVAGYATPDGGGLAFYPGNLDAFAPQSQESFEAIGRGDFPSPFRPDAQVLKVPCMPDFVAAGMFIGHDGPALVAAARHGQEIYVFTRRESGIFQMQQTIPVSGTISALATYKDNSGVYAKLVVGIDGAAGPALLLYTGSNEGLASPASFRLNGEATAFAFGNLDGDAKPDVLVVAGGRISILHGGSQTLEPIAVPFTVTAAAVGNFISDREPLQQMALLADYGSVHIFTRDAIDSRPHTLEELHARKRARVLRHRLADELPSVERPIVWREAETISGAGGWDAAGVAPQFFRTRVTGNGADDLMILGAGRLSVIAHPGINPTTGIVLSRPEQVNSVVTALPLRVNVDGRPGVAMLQEGIAPLVMMPVPDPTFFVNRFDDPAPGVVASTCNNSSNTDISTSCSLREAVRKANATSGADTIMLAAGTYTLSLARQASVTYDATAGSLDVTDSLTIVGQTDGSGNPASIVQGGSTSSNGVDQIFRFNPDESVFTNATISVSNVVMQWGFNRGDIQGAGQDGDGGAVEFDTGGSNAATATGTLTLTNCLITDNQTTNGEGGGIAIFNTNGGTGAATINNSTIQNNTGRRSNSSSIGGGIAVLSPAHMTATNTKVMNNSVAGTAPGAGGGIAVVGDGLAANSVTIHGGVISGNTAGVNQGGGIYSTAGLTIDQGTVISGNTSSGDGGGIWFNGHGNVSPEPLSVTKIVVTGNTASGTAAGGNGGAGGGIFVGNANQPATISFSRFASNSAVTGKNLYNEATQSGVTPPNIGSGSAVTASNNWWGTNAVSTTVFPATSTCSAGAAQLCFDPYIVLTHAASPAKIRINQSATLTGDMSKDNHGNSAALSGNLNEVVGLPITFDSAVLGTIPQPQPEALGNPVPTATATFNAGGTGGLGSAHATVDQAVVSVNSNLIASATEAGTTATITTVGAHNFAAGNQVTISGVGVSQYNGSFIISSVNPPTQISYTAPSAGLGSSTGGTASIGLVVLQPPSIVNTFSPKMIQTTAGTGTTVSTITFAITNGNVVAINANFTDNLPANIGTVPGSLVVAGTPNVVNLCGGTVTAAAGSGTISYSNNSFPVGTCSVKVDVQSAVDNSYSNSVTIDSTDAGTGNSSSDTLSVINPPHITKSFGLASIPFGATTSLTLTVSNPNQNQALSAISFTDTLPSAATGTLVLATPSGLTSACTGTASGTAGAGSVSLSGASLAPGASCTVLANVQGTKVGATNNSVTVSDTTAGTGNTATANATVVKADTSTAVTSPVNPSVFGQSVTFTATLSVVAPGAGTPTGTVTFLDGGSSIGSGTLTAGIATFTTAAPVVGNHTITTNYVGDANFNGSTGSLAANPQVVNKADTTTTVTSSVNPSVSGQSVSYTATVSGVAPGAGTATGTVTFLDGGSSIGSGTLTAGVATFTTTALAVGNHTITTNYAGDANFNGSTGSLTGNPQVVNKADTATAVTSSQNPSGAGQSVTFTATVSAVAPGGGTATGTVTFLDGGSALGTGTLSGGAAIFTTSSLSIGNHTITTTYAGDGNFNSSTGSMTGNPQVVNKATTTTTATSSVNPAVFGQSVTFTATVSVVSPGTGTATGTVTFLDGAVLIGTGTLSGGTATFTASALPAGSHTISASYGGDSNLSGSSGSLTGNPQVVNKADTSTAVTSSVNASVSGQSITFTATLSAVAPGVGTATGTVTFLDGGSAIGTGTLTGGVATLATSALAVGNHTITTTYVGDGNFNGSAGSLSGNPQVVNKASTATTVTSSRNPAAVGQSVIFTATVGAVAPGTGTATGTVTFLDGGISIGTGTLNAGVATLTTSALALGNHTITTSYAGDGNFNGSAGSLTGNPEVVIAGPATHFLVSAPAAATGNVAFTFTVTALDQANNTAAAYAGTVQFTSTDALASLPASATLTNGVGTFSARLRTGGSQTITATDATTPATSGTSGGITVTPAVTTHFQVTAPASASVGTAFNFTVTALDATNNVVVTYAGTVHFTSTDGQGVIPANSTLTSGVGTFSASLKSSGAQSITATDTTAPITGVSGNITVGAGAATHLAVSAPATALAGTAFGVTVTALDSFNNTATGYTGTVHFSGSDGQAILPANSSLTNGTGSFAATLRTAGPQTISAADAAAGSIAGSAAVAVSVASTLHFNLSAPATAAAGTAFNFTLTVLDQFDNVATGYSRAVSFATSDTKAVLPASSTLTAGVGTFSATLKSSGARSIAVSDSAGTQGSSGSITVSPGAPANEAVAGTGESAQINAAYSAPLTVTVTDAFGNPNPGLTVTFSAPPSGASVTFLGAAPGVNQSISTLAARPFRPNDSVGSPKAGGNVATAVTNAQGVASIGAMANGVGGRFLVTASVGSLAASFSLENVAAPPPVLNAQFSPPFLTLRYTQSAAGAAPNPAVAAPVNVTATFPSTYSATTSEPWLSVSPASGATGGSVTVSATGANLAPGIYNASVMFTFGDGSAATYTVQLYVNGSPQFKSDSAGLAFTAQEGSTALQRQSFYMRSGGADFAATLAVSDAAAGGWLSATPGTFSTPANISAQVNPAGLKAGTYQGSLVFTGGSAANSPFALPVTLTISPAAPQIGVTSVVNAASFGTGAVAPNTIVTAFGTFPGCAAGAQATVDGASTSVFYSSAGQISLLIPASVAGESTAQVQISCAGLTGPAMSVPIAPVAPSLFTVAQNGTGQAGVVNQDGGIDTPSPAGTAVQLYGTGFGIYTGPGADGLRRMAQTVTATIGGFTAQVLYAGEAPNNTLGLQQIDVLIPANVPHGAALALQLTIGGVTTQTGLTLDIP